jgi:hypothetical protein
MIEKQLFWPEMAFTVGITPLTATPSMNFGKNKLYFLGHAKLRASTAREIDEGARDMRLPL